jgi:fructosamine-3-kinase
LHGGDINQVFSCKSAKADFVVKMNHADRFPQLFEKEAQGLEALRKSNTFVIPRVISHGEAHDQAYLLLEHLAPHPPSRWKGFGEALAQMHRDTQTSFGFESWNYIGSLRQHNEPEQHAADFLINQRLEPQFRLAEEKGFHFSDIDKLYKRIPTIIPNEAPALIHGDLWSGNYLATTRGFPLIDPAVSYGIREMDLAMMRLFGGFPPAVFAAYQSEFPAEPGLEDRLPLYQLYYILVHVNLFGISYYERAKAIISTYV